MRTAKKLLGALTTPLMVVMLGACSDDDQGPTGPSGTSTTFTVTVENVSTAHDFAVSGEFDTPVGAGGPAPIGSGEAYEFTFGAAPGSRLSFATMFVHSNDLFFAPDGAGIALFDAMDIPVSGDVTAQVMLWDAGAEMNEEPGEGPNQAPRQAAADTGPADANPLVRLVNDGFAYPAVGDVIQVTVTHLGANLFRARIENVSIAGTLVTSTGQMLEVPMAPGVFVVHTEDDALFTAGAVDRGEGLEGLAEDGASSTLAAALGSRTGLSTPLAPGVFAVHSQDGPLFTAGSADRGEGLEGLAEDGDPSALATALEGATGISESGVFNTPDGAGAPAPILPGESYSFAVTATDGDRLSLATMFVQSNDLFYAPPAAGIALFDGNGAPTSGNVTGQLSLWDGGTEANQWPGAGPDQAPRQSGADTGAADSDTAVRRVADGFGYPAVDQIIRVTVTPAS